MPELEPLPEWLKLTPERLKKNAENQQKWAFEPPNPRLMARQAAEIREGHLRYVVATLEDGPDRDEMRKQLAESLVAQEKWSDALEFADDQFFRAEIQTHLDADIRPDNEWCEHDRKFTHRTRGGVDAQGRSFLRCGVQGCGFENTAFAPPELIAAEARRARARQLTMNQTPDEAVETLRNAGFLKEKP